jgi:polysaccharide export outer membrane protein
MEILLKSRNISGIVRSGLLVIGLFILLLSTTAIAEEYRVGDGDLLTISVYSHPDLESEVRVDGEGRITFALIGELKVGGLTVSDIEKRLAALLEDGYIKKAHVKVFIKEYKSKKVTVLGEFVKPGLVELTGVSTLLEVISSAGGVTPNAGDDLFIQRKIFTEAVKAKDITLTVNLKRLLEDGDITANVTVHDGDSIYVPRAAFVYVTGEVKNPDAYKITKDLTVLKAITLAGGFTEKAWKGKTEIIRRNKDGVEETITGEMDALVLPDDVILIPESFF